MKRILMAIMAVAVAVTFSAPAFAGDEKKESKDEKKGGHVLVYGEEKKDEKKKDGKFTDTFGEEKKKDEKGGK
jgi:Ni/Co efflux regulator RcnB